MTEHNQSKYYLEPYPTQNMSDYNNPYKFNGKEMDKETGMYYYGARYYDPRISIFVSVDPLAEKFPNYGGYVYTMNNPINLVDPTGMAPEKIVPRNMTQEQLKTFNKGVKAMKRNNFMFRELYNMLDSSPNNYYIDVDPNFGGTGAQKQNDGSVVLTFESEGLFNADYAMNEEFFHLFQFDNGGDDSELNWEFEAKTFTMISTRKGKIDDAISDKWSNTLKSTFRDFNQKRGGKKFIEQLKNMFFGEESTEKYIQEANGFSGFNRIIYKNDDYEAYKIETKTAPKNLQNFINRLDEK